MTKILKSLTVELLSIIFMVQINWGFALLKLKSKFENKPNIELSSFIDQIDMLDLISIETKKTEISSFLIIRIKFAQYKT
jgi:hypothetical protein